MANIILKDKNGNDAIFEGVDSVSFRTVNGGSVKFSEGGGGASVSTAKSIDELPSNAVDGSVAIVESDSIVGKWEWKDTQNPLDFSMITNPNSASGVATIYVFGIDHFSGTVFDCIEFEFVGDSQVNCYINDTPIYLDDAWDDDYKEFKFFTNLTDNPANYDDDENNEFISFIKTNCNRLSGGNSLYIRENGEWVYKCEVA